MQLLINKSPVDLETNPGGVALDLLRGPLGLTGVKEGCREGDCGACTVLHGRLQQGRVLYQAVVSCLLPLGDCAGTHLVTIEGLSPVPSNAADTHGRHPLSPLQQAFLDQGAIQCGFCTPGLIVALTGWLLNAAHWDEEEALLSIAGNICRCTGYLSIRRAVRQLLARLPAAETPRLESLIAAGMVPEYFATVPAQLAALQQPAVAGPLPGSIRIAGGTDLLVQKPERVAAAAVELIGGRADLRGIDIAGGMCRIGGAVTVEELRLSTALSTVLPGLPRFLKLVSSTQIRNRATVAGNLVNASPIGDLTILLLALGAEVELTDGTSSRSLPLRAFYLGYKKLEQREEELVAAVRFPLPRSGDLYNFEKVGRREHLDIASVNSACLLRLNGGRIGEIYLSAGGVAPVPLYLEACCAYLRGRELDESVLTEALRVAASEITPIDDVRGSAEYKRLLLRQLLRAHFVRLLPDRFSGGAA